MIKFHLKLILISLKKKIEIMSFNERKQDIENDLISLFNCYNNDKNKRYL